MVIFANNIQRFLLICRERSQMNWIARQVKSLRNLKMLEIRSYEVDFLGLIMTIQKVSLFLLI